MSGGRNLVWALAGLLLVSVPAMAEVGTLHGRAALPVTLSGHHETTGTGSFLTVGNDGQLAFQLQGQVEATRVIHRAFGFVNSQDPQLEVLWSQQTERIPVPMAGATIALADRLANFQLYASHGTMTLTDAAGAQALLGGLSEAKTLTETFQRPVSIDLATTGDAYEATIPAGDYQARATAGHAATTGAFELFVTGAKLLYTTPDGKASEIPAYFRTEDRPGALYNPVDGTWFGVGTHKEYIQESLLVTAKDGSFVADFAGVPGTLYAAAPSIAVDGQASFPAFTGTVQVQSSDATTTHALHGEALQIAGRFTMEPTALARESTATDLDGHGDLTTVSYGAVSAHYPWATLTAVGFGAIAIAAIAWAAANGKAAIGGGLGLVAGYARVHGDEVLEHPGRGEVYERVKAAPGVNFVQLSDQVAFGASTLNYHLRVLERNGYITSVRDGRYLRFFDRKSGTYSGERKNQVSALRNPTSAAMARHIRENPGVAQCDLASKFEVTPSTVTWHMNRLATAGLVNKERDQAHTRYYLAQGWANLPAEEQARFQAAPVAVAVTA